MIGLVRQEIFTRIASWQFNIGKLLVQLEVVLILKGWLNVCLVQFQGRKFLCHAEYAGLQGCPIQIKVEVQTLDEIRSGFIKLWNSLPPPKIAINLIQEVHKQLNPAVQDIGMPHQFTLIQNPSKQTV